MRINVKLLFFIVLVMSLTSAGCHADGKAEKREVLASVERYNSMLKRAYLEARINLMTEVATVEQANRVFPIIQALRAAQSSMIAEQDSFQLLSVKVENNTAVVTSDEKWTYWWQNMNTGALTKPQETISYSIRYRLKYTADGTWKVSGIEPAGNSVISEQDR